MASAWLRYAFARLHRLSATSGSNVVRDIRSALSACLRKNLTSLLIASPTFFRTFFRASGAVSIRLRPPLLMTDRPAGPRLFGQRLADLLDLIWVEVMVQDLERSTVPNACHASFLSCGSVFIIS